VIGTNKKDATETVQLLLEDAAAGRLAGAPEPRDLAELLAERGGGHVLYAGWEEIDRVEKAAGEPHGRPRVKLHSWDSLLGAARGTKTA
jgi:ferredoxin--NADP+ reductase